MAVPHVKTVVEHRNLTKRRQIDTGYIRTSLARVLNIKICIQYFTYVSTFYQNEIKLTLRLSCVFYFVVNWLARKWVIFVSWEYIICIYFLMFLSPIGPISWPFTPCLKWYGHSFGPTRCNSQNNLFKATLVKEWVKKKWSTIFDQCLLNTGTF